MDVAFLTTTVGWFPKPVALRRARWKFAEGEIDRDALRAAEADALRDVLELQTELGLDLLVDGQMDRGDMVESFAEHVDGMEPAGLVRCFGNRYYRRPRIVDEVSAEGPVTVDGWKAASTAAGKSGNPVKAVLTGPYTLMDWSFDEYYGSRERCCEALALIVRDEAVALADAGATEIQIDEPAISARPAEMGLAAEALRTVTAPLAGKARCWTHVCYGDLLPVIDEILQLPVDGLMLSLSHAEDQLVSRLAGLPSGKLLGAGVLDVHSPVVEDVGLLRSRIERLARVVPTDRLWLAPDSGLRTLGIDVVRKKLQALMAVAE